ncbi:CLUMA_CG010503, isoform A [Clunio marinus]|uniref:CLUMA_CG010503, isoform A n=1 Tax=Clunio marinus TaxID=568069 RepID=A0A1J1IDL1_9DIPT|nr:CLUMA_CG010503, isoform A [Clunio marinus]
MIKADTEKSTSCHVIKFSFRHLASVMTNFFSFTFRNEHLFGLSWHKLLKRRNFKHLLPMKIDILVLPAIYYLMNLHI